MTDEPQKTDTPRKPNRKPAANRRPIGELKKLLAESTRIFAFLKDRGFTTEAPSDGFAGVIWALHYLHPDVELTVELDWRDGFAGVAIKRRYSPLHGQYLRGLLPHKFPKPLRRPTSADRSALLGELLETLEQDARVLESHLDVVIERVTAKGPPPIAHLSRNKTEDDRYSKYAAKFSVSYMSDTKWRKAFTVLNEHRLPGLRATWKLIDEDRVFAWGLPRKGDLLAARLREGPFQPVEYRWIEWIRITPTTFIGTPLEPELAAMRTALERVGQLQLALDESGLTLFGYGT